jgi:hypothetical protein
MNKSCGYRIVSYNHVMILNQNIFKGLYLVHKGTVMHKCTKRNWAVHPKMKGEGWQGLFHKKTQATESCMGGAI